MSEELDFFSLNELLLNLGAVNSPSELQGMLCGEICGGKAMPAEDWMNKMLVFLGLDHLDLDPGHRSMLENIYQQTEKLLDDLNFRFTPLLPHDGASLARRSQELGLWCQGFLAGIGTSGLRGDAKLPSDVADALRDLAQISLVSVDDEDEIEENEVYWSELVEYVKVAVLTIYSELSASDEDKGGQATVH